MSNVPMTLPELVISTQAHPYSHTSSYCVLDDGRIFHSSFGIYNFSEDGGMTWTKPQWLKDAKGGQIYAFACVRLSDKKGIGLVGQCESGIRHLVFYRSRDNGQTWSEPTPIFQPHPLVNAASLMDVAIRTSSGRIVLPVHSGLGKGKRGGGPYDCPLPLDGKLVKNQFVATSGHFYDPVFISCFVFYSDDDGRTWKFNSDGQMFILQDWNGKYSYVVEPTVTEVVPGRLLMFFRTGLGRLFQAWSNDNGETWTRPMPTSLAACTTPSQLRTFPNGHLLCVWNQHSAAEIRRGMNRTRMSSAISRDGGRVWEFFQNIESIHETTRVPPGPIELVRPVQTYFPAGQPAAEWPEEDIFNDEVHTRFCYPSVEVLKDRVIVAYSMHGLYEEDPVKAQIGTRGTGEIDPETGQLKGQRLKILPFKWFYGGKEPADNPSLKAAYEPVAKPGL